MVCLQETRCLTLSFGSEHCGCTDSMACNYDTEALQDDGSCFYAAEGESCEATCLYDTFNPELVSVEESYTTSCELAATDIREPEFSDNCDDNLELSYTDEQARNARVLGPSHELGQPWITSATLLRLSKR